MRVLCRTGHADVGFHRSLYVRNLVGKSLDDAKAQRTAVDHEIEAIGGIGRFNMACGRYRRLVGLLCRKESGRKIALGGDPLISVLLELGIDRRTAILIANGAAK